MGRGLSQLQRRILVYLIEVLNSADAEHVRQLKDDGTLPDDAFRQPSRGRRGRVIPAIAQYDLLADGAGVAWRGQPRVPEPTLVPVDLSGVHRVSLSRALKRLEERGLVVRFTLSRGKYTRWVVLTPLGAAAANQIVLDGRTP